MENYSKQSETQTKCKYCGETKERHFHDLVLDRYACYVPNIGYATRLKYALLTFTPKQ